MAIRIPTSDQSKIFLGSQEIGAVYVGANKVWPDAPTSQFILTHTKQTGFTIYIACSTYNLVTINWGDGTNTIVSSAGNKAHSYSSSGSHNVIITGDLTKVTIFRCNSMLVNSITLTPDCLNITDLQLSTNLLSALDLSMCTKLITFYCQSNTSLSDLIMPSTLINTATRNFALFSTAISSYVNPSGAVDFGKLFLNTNTFLENVDVSNVINCSELFCYGCPLVNAMVMNFQSVNTIRLNNNGFSQIEVDALLANLVDISTRDASCTLYIQNGNANPSTFADIATLINRGWTVY